MQQLFELAILTLLSSLWYFFFDGLPTSLSLGRVNCIKFSTVFWFRLVIAPRQFWYLPHYDLTIATTFGCGSTMLAISVASFS